jgi:hypothetical protein
MVADRPTVDDPALTGFGVPPEHLPRSAFISGMDLGLTVGAAVALAGCLLALAALPSRPAGKRPRPGPSGISDP